MTLKRSRTLRTWLLGVLLTLLAVMLTACNDSTAATPPPTPAVSAGGDAAAAGPADAAPDAPPADAADVQTLPTATATPAALSGRIVLWHSWAGPEGDALAEMLATFQAAHPGVIVDTLYVAYPDLAQAYADAVRAGGGPDIVLAPSWWLGDLANAGAVRALDDLVSGADLAAYWPAAVENLRWNGSLYALPVSFETVSLFVNASLINPADAPATTADMLAQAQESPTLGVGLYNTLYHLYWGIPAYGATLFGADGRAALAAQGDVAGYLAWLQQLRATAGSYVDPDYGMLKDRFKKGEFAYFVDGPWAIPELTAALGDALNVAPLPAGPAGPAGAWLHADGFFLNPNSPAEQTALALAFARHATSAESGGTLARVGRKLPANQAANLGANALLQGFMRQAATAQPMPTLPEMNVAWAYAGDMFVKAVDGAADPAETVRETAALIDEANRK